MAKRTSNVSTGPKEQLLERTIGYLAEHGMIDVSLRALAAAIGTSHRMLIYHFGSKDGLFVAVVRAVETRQRAAFSDLVVSSGDSLSDVARQFWRRLSDPALAPHERLFFEMYGQALQGRPYAAPLLDGIVDSWLGPMTDVLRQTGISEDLARAEARLGIAVIRGLLLDLLATGDADGATAAFEQHVVGAEARLAVDRS
ncbi:MAG TPA: TetR/AcrR family transcriptional regulator [Acidimicrobiales bacterium]